MVIDIKVLVRKLIKKYGTNDPFELAEHLGLLILYHDLPIKAYRLNNIITLDCKMCDIDRRWVLAHELGHYFLHGPESTLGRYLTNNLLIKAKIEREADIFASELLLTFIDNLVYEGLSEEQLSKALAVPIEYIKYKFNNGR